MKYIIITILSLFTITIYSQNSTEKIITIEPYLSFQNYEHYKRLTLKSPDSEIEYLDDFDFRWGYKYKIYVKETTLKEWLSDGSRYSYLIKNVISKKKVADTVHFKLTLDSKRYYYEVDSGEQEMNRTFNQVNDSTFLYFGKVEIEVPSTYKETFNSIIEGKTTKVGTFIFVDDKRIRLIRL